MKLQHCFLVFFSLTNCVNCAKLLLTTTPQGRSHAMTFMPLMQRLVEDGHDVTVFFEIYKPELPLGGGVKENLITVKGVDYSGANDTVYADIIWNGTLGAMSGIIPFYFSSALCAHLMANQPDDFWHLANQTWDMVMTDSIFSTCGYAMALLSKKPYVLMHSSDLESVFSYFKAYGRNYGLVTPYFLEYDYAQFHADRFFDRVEGVRSFLETFIVIAYPSSYLINRAIGHLVNYSMQSYIAQSAFSFYDMPSSIVWPQPVGNDLVSFGAFCKPAKRLSSDYEKFVADPKSKGTILVAFGTICHWNEAPRRVTDAFVDALNNLTEYKIIWAYDGPQLPLKKHIMTNPWLPQQDILQDSRTVLFLSHGGLKSLKEAICSETPVVYMPMFAEQLRNSWLAREHNFAEYINKKNVTAEYLERKIRTVLNDGKYQTRVSRLRKIFEDYPIKALDAGSFWFRKLLKYGGKMPEFFYRRAAIEQSSFVYFHFDLCFIISIIIVMFGRQ